MKPNIDVVAWGIFTRCFHTSIKAILTFVQFL